MTEIDSDEMVLMKWKLCAVPHCTNRCCLALDSRFCFPHTRGWSLWKHIKIDVKYLWNLWRSM